MVSHGRPLRKLAGVECVCHACVATYFCKERCASNARPALKGRHTSCIGPRAIEPASGKCGITACRASPNHFGLHRIKLVQSKPASCMMFEKEADMASRYNIPDLQEVRKRAAQIRRHWSPLEKIQRTGLPPDIPERLRQFILGQPQPTWSAASCRVRESQHPLRSF
jgi:hypothetical protein